MQWITWPAYEARVLAVFGIKHVFRLTAGSAGGTHFAVFLSDSKLALGLIFSRFAVYAKRVAFPLCVGTYDNAHQ